MPISKGSTLCFLEAEASIPRGQWLVPGPTCLLAAKRASKGLPPCQIRLQMGKRESSAGRRGEGQSSKAIRLYLHKTASQWGGGFCHGGALRGNGWSADAILDGDRCDLWVEGQREGQLCWCRDLSVWSSQWEPVTISTVSVVTCQPGSLKSIMNLLWVSVFPPMKQRDWTRWATQVTSRFDN